MLLFGVGEQLFPQARTRTAIYRFDEFLVTHTQAGHRFIVKGNQPRLHAQPWAPPWREVPVLDRTRNPVATAAW